LFGRLAMLLPVFLLAGCGPDPQEEAARTYAAAMAPLLEENAGLAESFLLLAEKIRKKRSTPQDVADELKNEVIPRAKKLRDGAVTVRPNQLALSSVHGEIVRAWKTRVSAYERMLQAWDSGNLAAFNGAANEHLKVYKKEARYFKNTAQVLAPYGLKLEQYPSPLRFGR